MTPLVETVFIGVQISHTNTFFEGNSTGELDGKVAVITGGASGIGEESTRVFIREGAKVVIADMQEERGRALADKLKGSAVFIKTDVSLEVQVKAAVDKALNEWGVQRFSSIKASP